jgi:hypothetical protein
MTTPPKCWPPTTPIDDGRISADEYAAAQAALSAGFELTTTQATGLETAMTAVTKAVSDPQLFGRELGDRANQILQDMHNGVISVDDAIAQLNALPLDVTFNRAAASADSAKSSIDSMVDSLYGSATAFGAEAKAIEDTTIALREHKQAVDDAFVATNYSASLPVITQYTGEAKAAAGATADFTGALADGVAVVNDYSTQIKDLADSFSQVDAAKNAYDLVVGFTDGMVKSIGTSKDWADALIAPVGVLSTLDALYPKSSQIYKDAQQAQIDITEDYNRALEASQRIQIQQAGVVAQGADVTADYLQNLEGLPPLQQQIALGYADQNEALAITNTLTQAQAAANGDMSDAQKDALEQTILNRAALDSTYAAMLQQTGVLKGDLNDPSSWTIDFSVAAGGQDALDRLIDSVDTLTQVLAEIYNINLNHDEVDAAGQKVLDLIGNLGILDGTDTTTNTDSRVSTGRSVISAMCRRCLINSMGGSPIPTSTPT